MNCLIKSIEIYETEREDGRFLKSIEFRFPVFLNNEEVTKMSLDNESTVETVCLLSNRKPDTKVRIDVDLEDYYRIKDSKKNQG